MRSWLVGFHGVQGSYILAPMCIAHLKANSADQCSEQYNQVIATCHKLQQHKKSTCEKTRQHLKTTELVEISLDSGFCPNVFIKRDKSMYNLKLLQKVCLPYNNNSNNNNEYNC